MVAPEFSTFHCKVINEILSFLHLYKLTEHFLLEDPNWKYDVVPEFMDGKNIGDFVDADILQRLEELEKEEEMLEEVRKNTMEEDNSVDPALMKSFKEVKERKALIKQEHMLKKSKRAYPKNKSLSEVKEKLAETGKETDKLEQRVLGKRRGRRLGDNMEIEEEGKENDGMLDEGEEEGMMIDNKLKKRKRSISRSKSKGFKVEKTEMAKVFFIHYLLFNH